MGKVYIDAYIASKGGGFQLNTLLYDNTPLFYLHGPKNNIQNSNDRVVICVFFSRFKYGS